MKTHYWAKSAAALAISKKAKIGRLQILGLKWSRKI